MESDAFALRTALFLILATVLSAVTWTVFKEGRFEYKPYLVVTQDSVSGLALKARIYYKGVEVGTVEDIFFDDNDFDHVQILIHVDEAIPIARNTYAQLALRGITGEYDLRLDNDGPLGEALPTSEENPGVISMRSDDITKLGESVENALAHISRTSDRVSQLLNEDNQQKVSHLLTTLAETAEKVGRLEQALEPSLDEMPQLLSQTRETLQRYQTLAATLSERTAGVDAALASLTEAGGSVQRSADALRSQTLLQVERELTGVNQAAAELTQLLAELRRDPQRLLLGSPARSPGPGESTPEPSP